MAAELDDMLRRYLEREEADPVRKRLERQAEWSIEHDRKDDVRHAEIVRSLDGHDYRIGSLEAKASELSSEFENTGRHNLESLRVKARRIDDVRLKVAVGVCIAVLSGGLVQLLHLLGGPH
jgi:hypothetical protein